MDVQIYYIFYLALITQQSRQLLSFYKYYCLSHRQSAVTNVHKLIVIRIKCVKVGRYIFQLKFHFKSINQNVQSTNVMASSCTNRQPCKYIGGVLDYTDLGHRKTTTICLATKSFQKGQTFLGFSEGRPTKKSNTYFLFVSVDCFHYGLAARKLQKTGGTFSRILFVVVTVSGAFTCI